MLEGGVDGGGWDGQGISRRILVVRGRNGMSEGVGIGGEFYRRVAI